MISYQTKTAFEIRNFLLAKETLIVELIQLAKAEVHDEPLIINQYGVLKSLLRREKDFSNKARVKKNATPTEEQILFPVVNELYQILKVPVRGKINQFFIETLESALAVTRSYLNKIPHADL
ncbi:MAG: hypothetical protein HOG03_14055 [Desulfobacula sp.]|jgi:hypothetical protein|uniref:hypothetical protein n=1 Tax=Desulfobacula sp. TaxID=2593537 RepID=UPI001E155751|nr:hypothetical protein [Desulfobacula sp.]MBT3487764.1 hypothetical protein [Desulfobacula sp.]MBT3805701.1 hypothetical protein [Desulfobacula sp.]MBT4023871.1 hypothetical protein [Desulfobacula sp.]MBT4199003.1 hypothetical protein [Desulfobacula sp.]